MILGGGALSYEQGAPLYPVTGAKDPLGLTDDTLKNRRAILSGAGFGGGGVALRE